MSALRARVVAAVQRGDELTVQRLARLFEPGRRAAAILSADLELPAGVSQSVVVRFELIRLLATSIDDVVVEHKGIVGRHAGEWVTAFFVVDDVGSASTAARMAARAAREAITLAPAVAANTVSYSK